MNNLKTILEINELEFLERINQSSSHLMWFLGAGASRSSGLPTATDITWDIKRKLYCAQENQDINTHDISNNAIQTKIQNYMDSRGFPPLWDMKEYSFYFEQFFGENYLAQQNYIKKLLTKKVTSTIGHRVFSALMSMGLIRLIFTTNFDEVVEASYSSMTGNHLSTYHIEGSYAALDALNTDSFPLYIKLHGDFRYQSIKNLSKDLIENDYNLQKCFLAAATRFGMIVSGYSGRDENVMFMLKKAIEQNNAFPHGLFWTVPRINSVASNVLETLNYARSKGIYCGIVETGTFDEMLSKIWRFTDSKEKEQLDGKVRGVEVKPVKIPLPKVGESYPLLRTNAFRIINLPQTCGSIENIKNVKIEDIRSKAVEMKPNCIWAYTDRILFWGNPKELEKIIDCNAIQINNYSLDNLAELCAKSGIIKSFLEEALAKALIHNKPLSLRKSKRTWYIVVNPEKVEDTIYHSLKKSIGYKDNLGSINGSVPQFNDLHWAEAISIRIEERNGCLWLLLNPDIWISPLHERKQAKDFLRQRKLRRYNKQAFSIFNSWIEILLNENVIQRNKRTETLVVYPDSQYSASFVVSTRTAYSKNGANINDRYK